MPKRHECNPLDIMISLFVANPFATELSFDCLVAGFQLVKRGDRPFLWKFARGFSCRRGALPVEDTFRPSLLAKLVLPETYAAAVPCDFV